MNREQIEEFISITAPESLIILADNLDAAFIGVDTETEPQKAVYSIEKCIEILSEDMPYDEAAEYFWFNVAGSCGDGYPVYISTPVEGGVGEGSPYK